MAANDRLALRETLFAHLDVLGFDKARVQKEHGLVIHRNIFQSANVKAMEIVMEFLCSRILSPQAFNKTFSECWPVNDANLARKFKTTVHTELVALEKQGLLPQDLVRLSLLHSCSGDKFYELLLRLSEIALEVQRKSSEAALELEPEPLLEPAQHQLLDRVADPSHIASPLSSLARSKIPEPSVTMVQPSRPVQSSRPNQRFETAGNDFLKRLVDPNARAVPKAAAPIVTPLPLIVPRTLDEPYEKDELGLLEFSKPIHQLTAPKTAKKVHFGSDPSSDQPQLASTSAVKSILKKSKLDSARRPASPPNKAAVLRFSDEEGDSDLGEEPSRIVEFSPVCATFRKRATPESIPISKLPQFSSASRQVPTPSQRAALARKSAQSEPSEMEENLSRFAKFAPELNFPVATAPMIQSSPMRTPSLNLRKTLLPSFAEILKSPAKPFLPQPFFHDSSSTSEEDSPSNNENQNLANSNLFITPIKAKPSFAAFASPPRAEPFAAPPQWTPASERKKAATNSFLPSTIERRALESKFIEDDLETSLDSFSLTEIDDDFLAEGAASVLNSPSLASHQSPDYIESRRPGFHMQWGDEDDELLERLSTAKKTQTESKIQGLVTRESEGPLLKTPSFARALDFSLDDSLDDFDDFGS